MSLAEKILWSVLTLCSAFVFISLVSEDVQPHRFLFGLPFTLAILGIFAAVSMLTGGAILNGAAAIVVEPFASRAWWVSSALMVLHCLSGGSTSQLPVVNNVISILLCSTSAFFVLVDLLQCSKSWPKFDIPAVAHIRKPRHLSREFRSSDSSWNIFALTSCLLAVYAVYQLMASLSVCMDGRKFFDPFFISELGTGKHADEFTTALLSFGVFTIPFFASFSTGYPQQIPIEALKLSAGGCMAVCGIIGIGVWDLRHPFHYLSIAIWLWPLAVILDQQVPTPRGFVSLCFPTWIVKLCMAGYVMTMIVLPFDNGDHHMCTAAQRLVVASSLLWLVWLLKFLVAESIGLGQLINGDAT